MDVPDHHRADLQRIGIGSDQIGELACFRPSFPGFLAILFCGLHRHGMPLTQLADLWTSKDGGYEIRHLNAPFNCGVHRSF